MPDRHRERQFAEILFQRLDLSPTNIEAGERRDLRFEVGTRRIGMEITECTPEEYYRASNIAAKLGGPVVYSISHLGEQEERRDRRAKWAFEHWICLGPPTLLSRDMAKKGTINKSAITGRIISNAAAARHPKTSYKQTVMKGPKKGK